MIDPRWPPSIPQTPDHDGYSESPDRNTIGFKPDVGAAILRRRSTVRTGSARVKFIVSSEELATFQRFFEDETKDGSLAFRWAHPVTKSDARWQFSDRDEPYRVDAMANLPNYWSLSLTLTKLPG